MKRKPICHTKVLFFRVFGWLIAVLASALFASCITFVRPELPVDIEAMPAGDRGEVVYLARELGVSPTWADVEKAIVCDVTPLGRSRSDVERDLLRLLRSSGTSYSRAVEYRVSGPFSRYVAASIVVEYGSDNQVRAVTFAREGRDALAGYTYVAVGCPP